MVPSCQPSWPAQATQNSRASVEARSLALLNYYGAGDFAAVERTVAEFVDDPEACMDVIAGLLQAAHGVSDEAIEAAAVALTDGTTDKENPA
jgi:hypothetical protein